MLSELQRALGESDGLLLLCSGNMIRSAFGELYARHLGCDLPVRSAGTTYSNRRIHVETARALNALGIVGEWTRDFRPRRLDELDPPVRPGELILGMTHAHLAEARELGATGPGFLLLDATGERREIADPYFEGGFDSGFADVARGVEALVAHLRQSR